jgi:hypothetical protein
MEQHVLAKTDALLVGSSEAREVWSRKGYAGPMHLIPQFGVDPAIYYRHDRPARQGKMSAFKHRDSRRPSQPALVMGYVGLRGIIVGERRAIWIGMAKETAHQLGTPLSSLMGWLQLLKERCADDRTRDTVREMEKDVLRLSKISSRFGKVGSPPRLDKEDVVEIVRSAVAYQKRRLPSLGKEVEIREHLGNVPKALINPDLLEWAVENLLKNALDAMDKPKGVVEVRTTHLPRKGMISIEVEDNGRGIDPKAVKRIFEPGYTTRKGGWGLGLPLARRVVEEYHHGSLNLVRTGREGSLFVMEIPAKD